MFKNLNAGALGHVIPFDQACTLAKQFGFPGVDLDVNYLMRIAEEKSLQAAKEWFEQTGLRPGAISLSAKWREGDSDTAFEDSLTRLANEARLAAALGCTRCVTWVLPGSNTLDFYRHWDFVVPRLRRVASVLAEHGLRLGLEFIGPATLRARFKYDFVHTMDGMRALIAAIGADTRNVGLLLDCFHWYTAHASVSDIERLDPSEVVYVHVNDATAGRGPDEQIDGERQMVGASGVIDIHGFLAALRKIGYDGPVTVEPFNEAVRAMPVLEAVRVTSEALDRVLSL
ncbi:MAG: sugar phosphate isomerase/epimerase [Thermoflexales bacterium]|nr:sugar phosphate isomerase/epimerase [Thermoflexales bacterium]MDW8350449.1 sugar phosphate isomerase/epimerase family protein [Anaerolineae bacterium]